MLNNSSVKAEAHFLLNKPGNSSPFFQGQEAERPGPFLLLSEDEPAGMENGLVMRQCKAEAIGQASIMDSGSWAGSHGQLLAPWDFCLFIFRKFVLDSLVLYSLLLGKNDIILRIL